MAKRAPLTLFKHNGKWCRTNMGGIEPSDAVCTVIWFALGKKPKTRRSIRRGEHR